MLGKVSLDILYNRRQILFIEKSRKALTVLLRKLNYRVKLYLVVIYPPEYLAFLMYPAWGALGLSFAWVFFLGLYWRRFNKAGAITAMLTSSVTFVAWSALGNPWGIYHIQMALLVSIPSTLLATWLTAPTSEKTLSLFFRANSPISIQRGQRIRKDMLSGE